MTWQYFTRAIAFQYGFWLSAREVDAVLWNGTAFPFAKAQYIGRQLHELFDVWRVRNARMWLPEPDETGTDYHFTVMQ